MISLKTVPLVIGDIEFQTTQFPAMQALEVMVSLQRLTTSSSNTPVAAAAASIMSGLEPAQARKLVMDLFQCTTALVRTPVTKLIPLTSQGNIDLVFSGKLKMLFEVMGHAIEVNYGDFGEGDSDQDPQSPAADSQ